LSVLDTGKQVAMCNAVAPQLIGHDHPRHILQTFKELPEEAFGGSGIAPVLNEDVEHNAILIHGTPEIVLHALDPDEDLVQMPFVAGLRPAAAQTVGEALAELLAPPPYRLIGDHDAAQPRAARHPGG